MGIEWFLSVARPPARACCSPVRIKESGEPVTHEQLDAAAKKAGLSLPPDHRAFLLLHNGGVPTPSRFEAKEVGDVPIAIQEFRPFKPGEGFISVLELYDRHVDDEESIPLLAAILPMGMSEMEEDCLAVSAAAESFGAVLYVTYIEGLRQPSASRTRSRNSSPC